MTVRPRRRTLYACSFAAALTALFLLPPPGPAVEVEVESETILRYFERDVGSAEDEKVAPVYEYLRAEVGRLEGKGLSFHAHGWGRLDLADSELFEDRAQGEVLYGYLQYTAGTANLAARLGRQYVFDGVANESVDGVRLSGDLTAYFGLSLYGGQPVSLEEVDGRGGDRIWGGRLAHRFGQLYEVGVSYKRLDNDGAKQEESLGLDGSLELGGWASVRGLSVRNLETDGWREHAYEARVPIWKLTLRPFYERFVYEDFFTTGVNTASPFRFLAESEERVQVVGGDLTFQPTGALELQGKLKRYDYDRREERAWYYGALAGWRWRSMRQVGLELGRMDGDTDDTRYSLYRGYLYYDRGPGFVSADLVYVRYDEDILDEDRSIFASLGGGLKLWEEALELSVTGDASADPYFDRDYRGTLVVKYLLDL